MNTLRQIKKRITGRGAFVPSLLRFFVFSLSLCAAVPAFVSPASAEVPVKFNYQGNLRQAGFLVNGQRSMVFRLYNSSAPSATEIWTSPAYAVSISTGVFRVTLEPLITDWQNGSLWLELEVEGNRMSPREELASSPYSINTRLVSGKKYETAALAPVATALGDLWYNTASNGLNFWNGTNWVTALGTGSVSPHADTHSGTGTDPILALGSHIVTGNLALQGILNPSSNLSIGGSGYSVTFASSVTAGWFRGNGALLTNLNASRITTGLLSGDRIGEVIVSSHIVNGSIQSQDLADGSVTRAKLNQSGCAEGDVLKLSGGQWICSTAGGAGAETDPLSLHNQAFLQSGATFYVSSGTVNDLNVNNTLKAGNVVVSGTLNPSSNLNVGGAGYSVTFASAVTAGWFYGDGSMLTGITGSDNLGNHIATTTLNMAGFPIVNVPSLGLAANVKISSEASAALGGGVRISSNVYIVGFSSAARYYGDGSGLTGISAAGDNLGNHIATTTLNMAGFDIVGASTLTVSTITTTAAGVNMSTNVFVSGNVGIGTQAPEAKLAVTSPGVAGEYIAVFHSGTKLAAWLRNK